MRTIFSALTLLALSLEMSAQQSVINLTPGTLAGWTVIGVEPKALTESSELSLPAGAQLGHPFSSPEVVLKITSMPVVGVDAHDWPVLEIGNSALVFSRTDAVGKLTLVLDDNMPIELPFSYSLDEAGRSIEMLTVGFSRQGKRAGVSFAGQTSYYPAETPGTSFDVVASAGLTVSWDFKSFEVVFGAAVSDANSTKNAKSDSKTKNGKSDKSDQPGKPYVVTSESPMIVASEQYTGVKLNEAGPASAQGFLELYTPPAHRFGRVNVVRAVASGQAK